MSDPAEESSGAPAIRPFRVVVPEEELAELRRRDDATWPNSPHTSPDRKAAPHTGRVSASPAGTAIYCSLPSQQQSEESRRAA